MSVAPASSATLLPTKTQNIDVHVDVDLGYQSGTNFTRSDALVKLSTIKTTDSLSTSTKKRVLQLTGFDAMNKPADLKKIHFISGTISDLDKEKNVKHEYALTLGCMLLAKGRAGQLVFISGRMNSESTDDVEKALNDQMAPKALCDDCETVPTQFSIPFQQAAMELAQISPEHQRFLGSY